MKKFLKKIAIFCAIITAVSLFTNLTSPEQTYAADDCRSFAGMPSWDCNVGSMDSEEGIINGIGMIAANVLAALSVAAGYIVVGFVIYGGYLYMMSSGDPGKAAAGKKAITNALIGLAIVICAYVIFNAIRVALVGNQSIGSCDPTTGTGCVSRDQAGQMIVNSIQWVAGLGGAVCAIFIVVGGWGYMTSGADPGKLQKAKNTILYAIIGLIIVALAFVITGFVSSQIREATNAYLLNSEVANNINKETLNEKV